MTITDPRVNNGYPAWMNDPTVVETLRLDLLSEVHFTLSQASRVLLDVDSEMRAASSTPYGHEQVCMHRSRAVVMRHVINRLLGKVEEFTGDLLMSREVINTLQKAADDALMRVQWLRQNIIDGDPEEAWGE